jgi:hypothetical protein
MYNIEFKGYLLRAYKQIFAIVVGYLYGNNGHTADGVSYLSDAVSISPYCSSDGYLTFKLIATTDWHASDLTMNLIVGDSSYTLRSKKIKITNALHSPTNI